MDELVKFEVINLPQICVVGKTLRYSDDALNNGDNRLPEFWDRCYEENLFAPLEAQSRYLFNRSHAGVFLDWYLGDGDFTYIVGMLMTKGATVPKGYVLRTLPAADVALCWVKCKSLTERRAVSFDSSAKAIAGIGRSCANMRWCIDLYDAARSVTPDENGEVILDCYIPLD